MLPEKFTAARSGITFPVDSVTPAENLIWTETLADSLARRFRRRIHVLPDAERPVVNAVFDEVKAQSWAQHRAADLGSRCHGLVDAVHIAFSQHRPLILSPDSIWLVIAQGFSHHVAEHAETLRPRLVRHQGQRDLLVRCQDLSRESFQASIADLSEQIREATDPVLHETLVCDFSTTGEAARTASEVAIMDTFSSYFTYTLRCVCGIPRITLEGTADDWRRIRARVEVLATYDLEWWVSRLRPILDEFVRTAEGNPDEAFWQAIYKPAKVYVTKLATGWITDLFPYLDDAPDRVPNPLLAGERQDWALKDGNGISLRSFPSGLSSVPVKVKFRWRRDRDVEVVAGFFGVEQNPADMALSPLIGWSVTEPRPETPVQI